MSAHFVRQSVACFLLLGVALIFVSEGAEAKDYEWEYETNGAVTDIAISDDGKYLVSASYDDKINFFDTDSSSPEWSYDLDDDENFVDISSDGYF